MKRSLAILALVGVVLAFPLTALATDDSAEQQGQAQGLYVPGSDGPQGSLEQDNQGDPDELGGGFRGSGQPPATNGTGGSGIWVIPIIVLFMQLV